MKFRLFLLVLITTVDIFILPYTLKLPINIKNNNVVAWKHTVIEHPLSSPVILFKDAKLRNLWLWSQPAVGALILALFLNVNLKKENELKDIGGPESAGSGQFGTARWQTEKEKDKNFFRIEFPSHINRGGIVLGSECFGNKTTAWLDTDDTHVLIIGDTRSGKSRKSIMPSIMVLGQSGESMICTDPKKELYDGYADYLRSIGYKVVLLDFHDVASGNRWNLLHPALEAYKNGDIAGASKAVRQVSHMLTYQYSRPEDYKGESVWPNSQKSLTSALAMATVIEAPEDCKHLASVYRTLIKLGAFGGVVLDNYFYTLGDNHPANILYGVANMAKDRMRGSVFTSAGAQLELWADYNVAWLTAKQDHDLSAPGKEKTAVFLVIPDEDSSSHLLAALYINQVFQALTELARSNGGQLPLKVNFLLDEFGNLPPIPDFSEKITVAGGRGIKFVLAVQGLDQIKRRYKENATTITGNCKTWVYISTADIETAKIISQKTGQYTLYTESHSSQVRKTDHTEGSTQGLAGRALLLPDEVLKWPVGKTLILRSRNNPAYLPVLDISEWPASGVNNKIDIKETKERVIYPPIWIPGVNVIEDKPENIVEEHMIEKEVFDI